jgi:hypothetical protein
MEGTQPVDHPSRETVKVRQGGPRATVWVTARLARLGSRRRLRSHRLFRSHSLARPLSSVARILGHAHRRCVGANAGEENVANASCR